MRTPYWSSRAHNQLTGEQITAMDRHRDEAGFADPEALIEWLAEERGRLQSRGEWHALLSRVAGEDAVPALIKFFEEMTGVAEVEAFPAEDPGPILRCIQQAEALRQRMPKRARPDPAQQMGFGFPEAVAPPVVPYRFRNAERPIIEKLVRAWLNDDGPSPIESVTLTGRRGKLVWALGRLSDGGRVLIQFKDETALGAHPMMTFRGPNIAYDREARQWVRDEHDDQEVTQP